MKTKTKVIIVTLVLTVITFLLARVIWPDMMGAPVPTSFQLPFFIIVAIVEDIAFGLGVSFLLFGYKSVKNAMPEAKRGALATYISIAWLLMNWWPHDNLHRVNGMNLSGLIKIDIGFHITLIVAAIIVAVYFLRAVKRNS
ncbi:MAG: hypothetical protein PHS53_00725 [Candidatus Pacebacteria bacterium]|nr:hypothetical protein [Candidatus Paceibacterota bacterium]MDD5356661.1 hypothetical protein [Candidatus Paceibacterota bacterium]